jgi:hypothetical protein
MTFIDFVTVVTVVALGMFAARPVRGRAARDVQAVEALEVVELNNYDCTTSFLSDPPESSNDAGSGGLDKLQANNGAASENPTFKFKMLQRCSSDVILTFSRRNAWEKAS